MQLSVPSSWHPSATCCLSWASSNYDNAITGVILIVIVVVDALLQHRSIVQNRHARLNARVSPKATSEVLRADCRLW